MGLSVIGFAYPALLWALLVLPLIWLLLRAVPPAPVRRLFPGVALLLGLSDDDSVTDRTPWWLLLLRMAAVAAIIVGLAQPTLNPRDNIAREGGPLLILMDGGWSSAPDWEDRVKVLGVLLDEAARTDRLVALHALTSRSAISFKSARDWRAGLAGLKPSPWPLLPDAAAALEVLKDKKFETWWLTDGLDHPGRKAVIDAISPKGKVTLFTPGQTIFGLRPARVEDGLLKLDVVRNKTSGAQELGLLTYGKDPNGNQRLLDTSALRFDDGKEIATVQLDIPNELRGRISYFALSQQSSAGAVSVADDSLGRRKVGLVSQRKDREGLELLAPLHYIERALKPNAELLPGTIDQLLPASPDVMVLADVAKLPQDQEKALIEWVEEGGLLLRFSGPRLAASEVARRSEHPLMPVRLRTGGRLIGGAMSWGSPKALAPFEEDSPFYGLNLPNDVRIKAQVMAQPDPNLAKRVIARLEDGTPLVTRKALGKGQVVLFHISANAEWSSLPLSGLFVEMLERLSVAISSSAPTESDLAGRTLKPVRVIDGFGNVVSGDDLNGVAGEKLINAPLSSDLRPGVYQGADRSYARNVNGAKATLTPFEWPAGFVTRDLVQASETKLGGWLLALAILLASVDALIALALTGRLTRVAGRGAVIGLAFVMVADRTQADDAAAIAVTSEITIGYVLTGNRTVDQISHAGIVGLSNTLNFRTSVEPSAPKGINLEKDVIAFYPLIYWPITPDQKKPSSAAYEKLNNYLRNGGMILFDTKDADIAEFGASSPNGRKLRQLAGPLNIPALEPVPNDHVLTRTFYLLQQFPGRHNGRSVWVEAAPAEAKKAEGMPFRNLNDGVTPVVIGGNDWARAWAMDKLGNPMFPVGRGMAGARQREMAYRFGVNLVMHVLTGNYKSDQVHVPALLERLGQ